MSPTDRGRAQAGRTLPTADGLARAWHDALAVWDVKASLSPPQPYEGGGGSHWSGDEPLAYIDLETRQVVVNLKLLAEMGAATSLTAVLAHEIGHHVRYPHTLGLAAALEVMERRLIPGLKQSLTNLFFDLLVNESVGRTRAEELCAVYRGFVGQGKAVDVSPLFFFYLAIYEELWGKEPGALVPKALIPKMEGDYPGCRADARVFAQTFYDLEGIYLQFAYFCCCFLRYIPDPSKNAYRIPMGADVPRPDVDDYDGALGGNPEVEDALEEAGARGWIADAGGVEREDGDPLAAIDRITEHMPGAQQAAFREALVSKHYKRLVDQHVIELPAVRPSPEPFLPTVTEEWEWGDNPRAIDWTATVLSQGHLAGTRPLRRELEPEPPPDLAADLPAVEIYLDTSGSMPNPAASLNAMTLAAQVLAASAIRKKGIVRGVVYSSGQPLVSPWMYDEETARKFLLNYSGGGTDYPFQLLLTHADERPDAIRVIVSDSDFLYNVRGKGAIDALRHGIQRSRVLVALLALRDGGQAAREALKDVLGETKFRLAVVADLAGFAKAAAELAEALLSPAR